uniref:Small ubiquitin like modifier 2 n=1 Tax=Laticauda laticaudata TaxID=8630 RepID=A0A8C5SGU2_LATLA
MFIKLTHIVYNIKHGIYCNYLTWPFILADFCLQEGVKTENNDHINLKVAGQDGSVVQFKIKRHTPLSKLMKAYCERQVRNHMKHILNDF